jgi:hypothetical protein
VKPNGRASGLRTAHRSWPLVSAMIALGALLVGYADLWRGGVTVAPLFLTLGYVVFVPMAILAVRERP